MDYGVRKNQCLSWVTSFFRFDVNYNFSI